MPSLNEQFILATLILYILGSACYFIAAKNKRMDRVAFMLAVAGLAFNLLTLINLTIINHRLPLATGYEFLLSFTWITVLTYLIYEIKSEARGAGGAVLLIAALLTLAVAIQVAQLGNSAPLMPALKSPWLTVHVLTAALAYGGFSLAAGLAVRQLRNPQFYQGEEAIYRIVAASFAMLSLSIVLGAVWAEQAWGSYWSWDPKETWALITWIVYALYLHLHRQSGWRGKTASIMVIVGFIIVLFTFFGVNYFMSGLHSYA